MGDQKVRFSSKCCTYNYLTMRTGVSPTLPSKVSSDYCFFFLFKSDILCLFNKRGTSEGILSTTLSDASTMVLVAKPCTFTGCTLMVRKCSEEITLQSISQLPIAALSLNTGPILKNLSPL